MTTSGAAEVTLDIELLIALAPGASSILVYEAANSFSTGILPVYNKIATDNLARQVSVSWGLAESYLTAVPTIVQTENAAFQQMAAQGQTIYAASGDSGAYADESTVGVQDPSSPPYVTGVCGTQRFVKATAISGTGWSCTLSSLSCTRSNLLAAGASYPVITVTVNVLFNTSALVTPLLLQAAEKSTPPTIRQATQPP